MKLKNTTFKDKLYDLQELISNLNKAEKRNFRLHLKSKPGGSTAQFARLFTAIDKWSTFDESVFLEKNKDVKPAQMANLKISLYNHLLDSLRRQHVPKDVDLQIRENIDYSGVLLNKGLVRQSQRMLDKASQLAAKYKMDELHFETLYREKIIELQFSGANSVQKATQIRRAAETSSRGIARINAFAGLALQMHARFIEKGYLETQEDLALLDRFFQKHAPEYAIEHLSFNEKLHYHRAMFWYYYIQQDFVHSYRHSRLSIELLDKEGMAFHRPITYLKSFNSLLNSLSRLNRTGRFRYYLAKLETFGNQLKRSPNDNLSLLFFKFHVHHSINLSLLEGDFEKGLSMVPYVLEQLKLWESKMESRSLITLYYKIGCLYFGIADYKTCLRYLNQIIHREDTSYRQDIHGYARILRLVALYEQGEIDLLFNNVRSTYQYFVRQQNLDAFHQEIILFLKQSTRYHPETIHPKFNELRKKMILISKDPLARKPFYYFDIISWLESQLDKRPVAEVIQERGLGHRELF